MDATEQELVDAVAAQTTLVTSLTAYNSGWEKRLQDAMDANGGVITQDKLNEVVASMKSNNEAIAAAMVQNTPNQPIAQKR